ncbi:uncharacterized protein Z518_08979 [Rhinocladiella mackenziei CBS 650.93]|uniref:Uncharacterized protein n=1 Tax=Rhinocladiella mackenziei CBS 650.93 TaxID=1442369 RepID=A0A0D2I619_9EURO|nr:uncharacterized protein Z518_08979 [Rhinocladiella mackenziei CBS 650.93]KIX01254.1 hypothetical protein Z518_08979 [Rhinocladiella mackenziei CBS 650.93]
MDSSIYNDPQKFFAMMQATNPNLPVPSSFPSASKVRQESKTYSKTIFESWNELHQILIRREDAIRKRWMKKTKDQRKKILLTVWPEMPLRHRPDFQELARPRSRCGSMNRDAFKWPYINQEDLVRGKSLLLFLNARARNPPHVFAHADHEATHVGQTSKAITLPFLNQYTMYLVGQTRAETYGRLVHWDDDPEAFDLMHNCLQFQPGAGLLVLEIQSKTYSFLVQCCCRIFHDVARDDLSSPDIPIRPEPAPIVAGETSYAQLSSVAAEAPYRVPAKLETHRLLLLVGARKAAAEDHIWDLREDPGYFSAVITDFAQHRQESLLDINGDRHPHDNDEVFWNRVATSVITDAYMGFLGWEVLYRNVANVDSLSSVIESLDHQAPLPESVETALLDLAFTAEKLSQGPIMVLKSGVPASPLIRERFVREPQEPGTNIMRTRTKSALGNDPLIGMFFQIWNEEQVFLARLPNLVDELQRCMDEDPVQKKRMSSYIAASFSDLALIAQVMKQTQTFFPWAAAFERKMSDEDRGPAYTTSMKDATTVHEMLREGLAPNLARLITPLHQKFRYPVDKAYNATNVDAMRQAESHLDIMWKRVDDHFMQYAKTSLHGLFDKYFVAPREIRRTPIWTSPQPGGTEVTESEDGLPSSDFSRLNIVDQKIAKFAVEPPRAKIKTKGIPRPATSDQVPETIETDATQQDELPTFTLGKRAWKVFSTMFHQPSQKDHAGEISWSDFLHAMTATGFKAEKLYGSVWQFTPSEPGVEHSIHIHEPHPVGKISFRTARRLGRRLFRTYGWTGDMFKLV